MICPRCKKDIDDNIFKCPYCNTRLKLICPDCKTLNNLGSEFCVNCNKLLIRYCPECNSANLPTATSCRKCHTLFSKKEDVTIEKNQDNHINVKQKNTDSVTQTSLDNKNDNDNHTLELKENIKQDVNTKENARKISIANKKSIDENEEAITTYINELKKLDQLNTKKTIVESIFDNNIKVIGLNAQNGDGKTLIIKHLIKEIKSNNPEYIILKATASSITQIATYGLIQDLLLNFFDLPSIIENNNNLILEKINKTFNNLDIKDIDINQNDLLEFLYPENKAKFEDILSNRIHTENFLIKIFNKIIENKKVLFIIDDFNLIDGGSFKFLNKYINENILTSDIKILISYPEEKYLQAYFYCQNLKDENYKNIFLNTISKNSASKFIDTLVTQSNIIDTTIKEKIFEYAKSSGSNAYIEQIILLFWEIGYLNKENNLLACNKKLKIEIPLTIKKVIKLRLEYLNRDFSYISDILYKLSLIGFKFHIETISNLLGIEEDDFKQIINFLVRKGYIIKESDNISFKNLFIWKIIYEEAKKSDHYEVLNKEIFENRTKFKFANISIVTLLAQNSLPLQDTLNYWEENSKIAASIGDINIYIISLQQYLKLLNNLDVEDKEEIINKIETNIGKILYDINPESAINYLSNVVDYANKRNNIVDLIDLSGYLLRSCNLTNNYLGAIETVDLVLKNLPVNQELQKGLIKSKKLNALFKLGNYEEIINISQNEIIFNIENELYKHLENETKLEILYNSWLETNIYLLSSLAIVDNEKFFKEYEKVISNITPQEESDKVFGYTNYCIEKIYLSKAMAYTVRGDISNSNKILNKTIEKYSSDNNIESKFISFINVIEIINRLILLDFEKIMEKLFEYVTFANNCNDESNKNIFKTLLGYVYYKKEDLIKANKIIEEQLLYFVEKKESTGALLCWYLIASIAMKEDEYKKALEISQKALEIAKNVKINNTLFIIMYKKLLGEIYIKTGDFESSKMYLEKGLVLAKENKLDLALINLYQVYGKFNQELTKRKSSKNKEVYAKEAIEMYNKGIELAQKYRINNLEEKINNDKIIFLKYCELNNITISIKK